MNLTRRKILLSVIGTGVLGFLVLQVFPVGAIFSTLKRDANPPVTQSIQWSSPEAEALARKACYDCHSNETKYPWYAHIAPVSWLITRDVNLGRDALNFSEYDGQFMTTHLPYDSLEWYVMEDMPPPYYTPLHAGSDLTEEERMIVLEALSESMGYTMPGMDH